MHLDIAIDKYKPMSGSSYKKLPKTLAKKKALMKVQNETDNE